MEVALDLERIDCSVLVIGVAVPEDMEVEGVVASSSQYSFASPFSITQASSLISSALPVLLSMDVLLLSMKLAISAHISGL